MMVHTLILMFGRLKKECQVFPANLGYRVCFRPGCTAKQQQEKELGCGSSGRPSPRIQEVWGSILITKKRKKNQWDYYMLIIPATWKVVMGGWHFKASLGEKISEILAQQKS
jgi:hypothetical protein